MCSGVSGRGAEAFRAADADGLNSDNHTLARLHCSSEVPSVVWFPTPAAATAAAAATLIPGLVAATFPSGLPVAAEMEMFW